MKRSLAIFFIILFFAVFFQFVYAQSGYDVDNVSGDELRHKEASLVAYNEIKGNNFNLSKSRQ